MYLYVRLLNRNLDSSVILVTSQLTGPPRFRIATGERDVSRPRKIPSCCGAHPGSYSVVKMVLSLGVKGQNREVEYSSSYSVEVQHEWSCSSTLSL
jgi:hypothetical protein